MVVSPGQIALPLSVVAVLALVWYLEGRGRWRARLEERFVYGVPWGTVVTVAIVVAFYLFAQGGLRNWSEPVVFPFVTWSYFYPTGQLTAGIAHGSPDHLLSNMAATLAFAPIAEYVWGHYPPGRRDGRTGRTAGSAGDSRGLLARPWVRAVVIVPAAMLATALLTAVFALGPGIGFSGAVYAIAGFAVVVAPLWAVLGVLVATTVNVVLEALRQPVLYATVEAGPPMPPNWAGVGFQAHLLGFLVGVVLAIGLLRYRDQRPSTERVFFATILFGAAQSLWLLVGVLGDDVYARYQAAGVGLMFVLAALVAVAAGGSDRPVLGRLAADVSDRTGRAAQWSIRRLAAIGWVGLLAVTALLGVGAAVALEEPVGPVAVVLVAVTLLLAVPALPSLCRRPSGPLERRQVAVSLLLVVTVLVAFPSVPLNALVVGDAGLEDEVDGTIEVDGYTVAYGENVTVQQGPAIDPGFGLDLEEDDDLGTFETSASGLLVVDADRQLFTVAVNDDLLAHDGNGSAEVGGIGWYEQVTADRSGWDVVGNDSAYAVDLAHDGETVRSFTSEAVSASVRLDGHEVAIEPDAEEFRLLVDRDGSSVGETPIPDENESATVGDLEFVTETIDDGVRLLAVTDDGETEVTVAEREGEQVS
ncbi:rhomboid family intramembrane serine protease [Natrarchaeobaculum aegyptiacum]|uniref:Peptidase n=1 Tax=Natrarchaeobaculum aegyptiacum TaxID=745377 RepID=A0A2Z2HVH0_9EURY|nr:rhomboid family intramembrane serine protease [Natrarchaeobaculum aegyptiacum]ARS90175.1 peptidase [Natrarchaeobaculum aegyptiacum]